MKKNIGIAAKALGVSQDTLRRWERAGKISVERTANGHRRYDLSKLLGIATPQLNSKCTIAYARVSSHDQKSDLDRQAQVLETFCSANGWTYEIIQDLGSGLNFQKRGLKKLIQNICSG
ncbi:MAG: IS607 family transposase, partial [Chlamydiota bacterium]